MATRRPDLRPAPRGPARPVDAAAAAGVSAAPARQLPGWRHGPARPRPRPSLAPAPTCAQFVYLAAMATRGGGAGRRKGGAGPADGTPARPRGGGREGGSREVISQKRAAGAGSSPGPRERARLRARGEQRRWRAGGGIGSRRVAPPRPSGPPATHPPVARAHGRARPAQPPGLRAQRRRPVRSSAPPRPFSPGGATRPPLRPRPLRPRRQPQPPRQRWGTLLSPREGSLATGPTYSPC